MEPQSEASIFKASLRTYIKLASEQETPTYINLIIGGFLVAGYLTSLNKDEKPTTHIEKDIEEAETAELRAKSRKIVVEDVRGTAISPNSYDEIDLKDVVIFLPNGKILHVALWHGRLDHVSSFFKTPPPPRPNQKEDGITAK